MHRGKLGEVMVEIDIEMPLLKAWSHQTHGKKTGWQSCAKRLCSQISQSCCNFCNIDGVDGK